MFRHKSLGLLTFSLLVPRVALRLAAKPSLSTLPPLPGSSVFEHYAARTTHYMLYLFMIGMGGTGVAMGQFGGNGLPFFFTTFKPVVEKNGAVAKQAFGIHQTLGYYGKFVVPLHVSAGGYHMVKSGIGNTLGRISPWGK